ncbi:MAG: hypothetical protein HUU46_15635 [Candidatus Hydrogenedentes bacterium]|nr:hypothetical protein [Candidatus Hydrogenedentota bacterium]
MTKTVRAPGLRPLSFLLVALSLSIGWGIRGNFGHEYGAMIPGALAGIAACLLSGREDWRERVAYFGMFGALGWAFGASISYMQVISYTHSGHAPSQLYGFFGLFVIGFLWAGMGGAGTALPAVADRDRLTELFRPLIWVFAFWAVLKLGEVPAVMAYRHYVWGEDPNAFDKSGHRQESPFYWFDADWMQALLAVAAMLAFDLWDRRREPQRVVLLLPFALVGSTAGHFAFVALRAAGLTENLAAYLVHPQGDTTKFSADNLLTNWPQFLSDFPNAIGALIGLILGLTAYFKVYGKFRSGSSLYLHMALGWLISFLIMPVILSNAFAEYGGFRMTPPRSDDWAGICGVMAGMLIYVFRNGLAPVGYASLVSAFVGGIAFPGIACLKLIMVWPGNPYRLNPDRLSPSPSADIEAAWAHWQGANWHSFLEQSYGFVNGIGIALAMGLLATRAPRLADSDVSRATRRWTQVFAASFVLVLLTYLNLVKNVVVWTNEGVKPVQATMKAPLFDSIELSAAAWFNLTYALIAAVVVLLLARHLVRPIALIPRPSLGKCQLFYLVFMWTMIIGNFERALNGFNEQRLLTEWIIIVNGLICTAMVLTLPRDEDTCDVSPLRRWSASVGRAVGVGIVASIIAIFAQFGAVRVLYGDRFAGHAGRDGKGQTRFGEDAEWKIRPNLRRGEHQ